MVTKRTVQRRIKKGMTIEQAKSTPSTFDKPKITKEDLLPLSTLGLSMRGASAILGEIGRASCRERV